MRTTARLITVSAPRAALLDSTRRRARSVKLTGRTTRERRSEYGRLETIEETAELVTAAGGDGIAVAVDHLEAAEVEALVQRIEAERGRLDVLVNDIWGGEHLFEWNNPVWEHDLVAPVLLGDSSRFRTPVGRRTRPATAEPRPIGSAGSTT